MSDLDTCPKCGGIADNGHDREYPPNAYYCKKCTENTMTHDTPELKEFAEECIANFEYGSPEYRLAEAYLNTQSTPEPVGDNLKECETCANATAGVPMHYYIQACDEIKRLESAQPVDLEKLKREVNIDFGTHELDGKTKFIQRDFINSLIDHLAAQCMIKGVE